MHLSQLASLVILVCAGAAFACSDPSGLAPVRYQLRTVDGRVLPALRRADTTLRHYDYVDSAAVEIVDDTSGWVSLAMHQVQYLENGDSLEGGWAFRTSAKVLPVKGGLVFDYRSRLFDPPYGSDFMGLDTAMIVYRGLVIQGDSLLDRPRTVYRYER
jgi:hypothetical protein